MVWLVGAGYMAKEYIKVLKAQEVEFQVIGRGEEKAKQLEKEFGVNVSVGGLESFLQSTDKVADHAVIASNVISLYENTKALLECGVKSILVEKPAFLSHSQGVELKELAHKKQAKVFVAYNRRYFASTIQARDLIAKDGGVCSFQFEFTEWGHEIETLPKAKLELEKWIYSNSSHVIDMAFFLGGAPKEMSSQRQGSLSWHPSGARYTGAGKTDSGSIFSYFADWESAGRWGIEILSATHRYIFRPMEKLQIQKKGSIAVSFDESIDYSFDNDFKPGLYRMLTDFLAGHKGSLCSLEEQVEMFPWYGQISGYE